MPYKKHSNAHKGEARIGLRSVGKLQVMLNSKMSKIMAHDEKLVVQKFSNTCAERNILCKAEHLPPSHVSLKDPQGSICQLIKKVLTEGKGHP